MLDFYLKLLLMVIPTVAVSALLYLAERRTALGKRSYWTRQWVAGLAFAGLAVLGTELGMTINGATMNVRNAAPLCAGLIFGAPAGIIAGVIGGVERYFAVYWGAGAFTQLACSISTVVAGLLGAALRRFMFDDKKPPCVYGLAAGIVAEVFDMLMVFLVRMDATREGFAVVEICSAPMISMNGVAVMLSLLAVSLLSGERKRREHRKHVQQISQTFQKRLLSCVLLAFVVTCVFTYAVQTKMSENESESLLSLNIDDVREDITDASDENLLALTREVANQLNGVEQLDNALLDEIAEERDLTEIDVIGPDGIVEFCTNRDFIGFDMDSGAQSREFLVLLDGEKEYVQDYQPVASDASISRKYAGVALNRGGFVQVGYDAPHFQRDIDSAVVGATRNRHVGEEGFLIICDSRWLIVSDPHDMEGQNLFVTGMWNAVQKAQEGQRFQAKVYDTDCYCMFRRAEGYYIIAAMPHSEAVFSRNVSVYIMVYMEVLIFSALFVVVYFLVKLRIVNQIHSINGTLSQITGGDLNVTVNVRSNEEFASLSDDINSTVDTLKRYIAEAAARIDEELAFAKQIQHSALPNHFPQRPEIDVWAGMRTAKEVGGDFYDVYPLGEDRVAFLVADVSGKGIPAALFMMTSKALIKSLAEGGAEANDAFTRANQELCEHNEEGMFVTAWMGILDLKTGLVRFANAGHNPPLVRGESGAFEYLKSRAGFVLAGMEGIRYRINELQLHPGDVIYLYTDGVTEATDANSELYGEPRLRDFLNGHGVESAEGVCRAVLGDVDAFVGEAPQFDDITMLCLRYRGGGEGGLAHDA